MQGTGWSRVLRATVGLGLVSSLIAHESHPTAAAAPVTEGDVGSSDLRPCHWEASTGNGRDYSVGKGSYEEWSFTYRADFTSESDRGDLATQTE